MPSSSPPSPLSSSYSAEIIGGNDDILTEILSYLPIKPLLRFKSVSKHLHSLISDPCFCLIHSRRHPNPPPSGLFLLLPLSSSPSFSFVSLYSLPLPPLLPPSLHPSNLLQSCNGLLLFRFHYGASRHILLFNPTTRFISVIPLLPDQFLVSNSTHIPTGYGHGQGQGLVSNPITHMSMGQGVVYRQGQEGGEDNKQVDLSNPTSLFGTGNLLEQGVENEHVKGNRELEGLNLAFDPARWPHYYLIMVFKHYHDGDDGDRFSIAVYGSNTRVWRDGVVWLDDAPFDVQFGRGVYWRGRVFWLSHTGSTVYYDVDNELVGRLVLPKVFGEDTYLERFRYFGECCGHLHLIEIRTNCVQEFDVLELEETDDGSLEWVVRFKVDLDVVGCVFQDDMFQDGVDRFGRRLRFYALSILAVIRDNEHGANDDNARDALVLSIPGKVISYSFKSRVSHLLCNVVDESDKWLPFRGYNAFQFIESLYRP